MGLENQKKGQLFIWTAFLISLLFFIGFIGMKRAFTVSETYDLDFYFNNIKTEIPKALNFGLNRSEPTKTLINFSTFIKVVMNERGADLKLLWLFTKGYNNSINMTIGNFLDKDETIGINISGIFKSIKVSNNSTNSTIFSPVDQDFNLTVNFDGYIKRLSMVRDKVNLYAFLNISRGIEFIQGDIVG